MAREREATRVLREARALIDRPWGWTKNSMRSFRQRGDAEFECFCASGALNQAALGQPYYHASRMPVRLARARKFFVEAIGQDSIPIWNDAPRRTKKDVLEAFDRAIELSKA